MLMHIHIKNFVIMKSLSLEFQDGLHVLTGETGAGKSIWIDAIEIGLGGRADSSIIYPGAQTCDIHLSFDLSALPAAKQWLQDQMLPVEESCVIRRILDRDKPSRTSINGIPVTQAQVRALSEYLLIIHGQHQHQQLLKSDEQQKLIDGYADTDQLLKRVLSIHSAWKTLEEQRKALEAQAHTKSADLTLYRYQLEEIQALNITENEHDSLFSRFQKLHQTKNFIGILQEALQCLNNEEMNACQLTERAVQALQKIRVQNTTLDNVRELLQAANIYLNEACETLEKYGADCDADEETLTKIEQRLTLLQDTARKHQVEPNQLFEVEKTLVTKIEALMQHETLLQAIATEQEMLLQSYQSDAEKLSEKRKKAAKLLEKHITADMQNLGMSGGLFEIQINTLVDKTPHPKGNDIIKFLIATNPGQTPHDLAQVVSGGELSRLSLIIQVRTAQKKNTPTLIFDEVDVGIGGKTATLVGKLLRVLGTQTQVLCVTHLAQVAAFANHHYCAKKIMNGNESSTHIALLSSVDCEQELARMLSGSTVTQKSLSHARELLTLES